MLGIQRKSSPRVTASIFSARGFYVAEIRSVNSKKIPHKGLGK